MLPKKYATPLRLERRPSYHLFCYLLLVHIAAMIAVAIVIVDVDVSLWLKWLLEVLIVMSCAWHLYVSSKYNSSFIEQLIWSEFDWKIVNRKQGECRAILKNNWSIHPLFIILEFVTSHNKKINILLTRDSIGRDPFRQLSIRLRNNRDFYEQACIKKQ